MSIPQSISRRKFLYFTGLTTASVGLKACGATDSGEPTNTDLNEQPVTTPQQALDRLKAGNLRYVENRTVDPNQSQQRRIDIAQSQKPFATILGCVDSRVPPELIFDRGLGDLFVIRSAGQVLDDAVVGSLEFGIAELDTMLLVVLGHERCGAVKATIESIEHHQTLPGSMAALAEAIRPAVEQTAGQAGDHLDNAVHANITLVSQRLQTSPILSSAISQGKLQIVGAYYDLDSGIVTFT